MKYYQLCVSTIITVFFWACSNAQSDKELLKKTEVSDSCALGGLEYRLIESATKSDSLFVEVLRERPNNHFLFNKPFIEYLPSSMRDKFVQDLISNYKQDGRPCSPIYHCAESFSYFKSSRVNIEVQKIIHSRVE